VLGSKRSFKKEASMKNALVLLWLAIPLLAQQYRLGEAVWDSKDCVLSWTVEEGKKTEGEFKPHTTYHFTIRFHEATMTEDRLGELKFSEEEAQRIDSLFHQLVSKYTVESTIWFFQEIKKKSPPNQNAVNILFNGEKNETKAKSKKRQ
jgi:tRNA U55 pseudouridine synthase TruB